jgi:hypothetical protein
MKTATVTLNFETRQQAEDFAKLYTRFTLRGNLIGSGLENVKVTVYDVTTKELEWIMTFVND